MRILPSDNDTVLKTICLPRWERNWINSHKTINFSGLTQEIIIELMRTYDPLYYEQNKGFLEQKQVLRKDFIDNVIAKNPDLLNNLT